MTSRQYQTIRCQSDQGIMRVTLSRPEVLNAINGAMLTELQEIVAAAEADPRIRVILVDSASERAFSAGIDVAYVKDMDGLQARNVGRELHRAFLALRTVGKPVVAAIDGLCLGAGLELAVSCDFMLASDRSSFGLPNIHRGIPAIVEAAILPLAIGIQGARELAFLGENWDAATALQRGLVHRVVPPDRLGAEVDAWCRRLAEKSPTAMATQKEIIHKWMTTDLESAIDFSINTVVLNFTSRDQQEGMDAFLEKRPAKFGEEEGG